MKLSSTRQAIHDALSWGHLRAASNGLCEHLVYLTRIEKSIVNNDPCADMLEAAYICAAVNTLKPHLSGWLKFAYSVEPSDLVLDLLAARLRFHLFPMSTAKKHSQLIGLSIASLEDYRYRLRRQNDLHISVYCDRIGIFQANFYRDRWDDKRDLCLDEIKIWDADAVGQVSTMVKSLRGEEDSKSPSEILAELGE